ncbi:MAG: Trp biosynthesis-associated membrane protein [Kineosporiaceae bacterium]
MSPAREKAAALIGAAAGAGLVLMASSRDWATAVLPATSALGVPVRVAVAGRRAAPAAVALALAVLAVTVGMALTSGRVRRVLGAVAVPAALGGALSCLDVARAPEQALRLASASRAVDVAALAGRASVTAWVWVAFVAWLLPLAAGLLAVVRGGAWTARSSPRAATRTADERTASPTPAHVWEALSRGEDPT